MDVAVSPQPPPSASSTSPTPVRMRRMRRHGCQTPFAPAQIVALGVVLLNIAVFYVFSVHELPSELRRIVLVLVSVQIAMVTLLYIAISLLDPAHPAVIERQQQRLKPSTSTSVAQSPSDDAVDLECSDRDANAPRVASPALPSSSTSPSSSLSPSFSVTPTTRPPLQCALCDASVSSGTRHCSVCRKCVAGFDHHCVYINTCIGSRNYPLFIALLTCSILLVATQLVIACFAIDCLRRRGDTTRALVVGGLSLPPLLQLICMIVLASFHSYLFCKGLRTYEWLQRWSTQKTTHRYAAKTPTWKQQSCRMREYDEDDDAHITHEDRSKDPQQHHNIIAQKIEVVAHV